MRVDCNNIVQMNAIVLYLLIHSICICCRDGLSLNIAKRLPVPKLLREEIVPKVRTLLIDNYDSYTYNLWQLLSDVNGIEPHVVYNNAYGGSWDALISGLQSFDNIVISPGPGSPDRQTDFGLCTDAILKSNIPLLGVCLGHQGMAHAYGGKVTRAQVPMHGRLSKLQHDDCGVFAGIDQNIEVVRYHSLVVDSPLPSVLRPTAWTLDGTIMGLEHRSKRQYGVQFHPESIKTACGRSLVTNFQGITLRHMQSTSSITNTVSVTKSKAFNFHNNSHQKAASVPSSTTPSTSTAAPQRHVHITTIPLPADSAITTEEVFSRLYGSHPASIWLDSQRPGPVNVRPQQPAGSHSPASSGRMTYMGALDTPGAYAVEYHGNRRLVKRTMTAPVNEVSKSHSTCSIEIQNRSIFEFLREKLAEEAASEPVITRSYRDIGTADAALASAEYDISITSALFGYLSYEVGQEAVNILAAQTDHSAHYDLSVETPYLDGARVNTSQPMALLMYPTQYVVYDHTQRVYRIVDLWNNDIAVPNSSQSLADRLAKIITTPTLAPETVYTGTEESSPAVTHVQALTGRKSQSAYKQDIAACLESISAGESYEVCLTTQFSGPAVGITDLTAHSLSMYKRLRALNPAPYASYLRYDPVELATGTTVAVSGLSAEVDKQKQTLQWYSPGGFAVCSTSPECFLKIDKEGKMASKPIKGTAKRDLSDPAADLNIATALAADEKSQAENLMIVDLVRNDLGRVCEVGSVTVPKLMDIESYTTVHQIVSTVQGQLCQDCDLVDALIATFPGGSMTGAPKLRTMGIIRHLEQRSRGIYSGSMGYIGLNGAADLSIIIRTAVLTAESVTIGAGGAIVAMSDPDEEMAEVALKATAVAKALGFQLDFAA